MSRSRHLPLDDYARGVIAEKPHAIVAWWLMASWLYYEGYTDADGEPRAESLLTDEYFDELSRDLLARWDRIWHPHKHLIDRGMLQAGTGFDIKDYPAITKSAALRLVRMGPGARPELPAAAVIVSTPSPASDESWVKDRFVAAEQGELL